MGQVTALPMLPSPAISRHSTEKAAPIEAAVVPRFASGSPSSRPSERLREKPINSGRFLNDCHEFIFHFTPSGDTSLDRTAIGVAYQDPSNVGRWHKAAGNRRCRGNAWFLPYETINSREKDRPHPATFPVRLPEYCLRLHGTDRARQVLDPFTGLGSTAVACARLGLDFVGIELDRGYLDIAVERAAQALHSLSPSFEGGA